MYWVILAELSYIQNIVQFVKHWGGGLRLKCVFVGGGRGVVGGWVDRGGGYIMITLQCTGH